MQMIWHQQVIAHQPICGDALPEVMKRSLDSVVRKPAGPILSADGQEDPVGSANVNMNSLRQVPTTSRPL
jgi:hypothetical protein